MKKEYLKSIALQLNSRGVYCLDTVVGCASGMANEKGGCYGDCYAAKSSKLYGFDFSKIVLRDFDSHNHLNETIRAINGIKSDFVRIGCSGDPSEDWNHTMKILFQIEWCNKEIVIITRHWNLLSDVHLEYMARLNICVNTSISALDKPEIRERCLAQYNRLKPFCKSVLRIVSANFNLENERGHELAKIQNDLFKNDGVIDTVLRVGKNNPFVKSGVITVERVSFMGSKTLASKFNKKTYMGKCSGCKEQCGVGVNAMNSNKRRGVIKQLTLIK